MEPKRFACFDLSHKSIKLLIGYCLGETPIVLYTREAPIDSLIEGGLIADREGLKKALSSFAKFDEPEMKLKGTISELCLCLPPFGLKIYEKNESTTSASSDQRIGRVDIANVITKVKNETIPGGNEVVDIIPIQFLLQSGEVFANPPVGKQSSSLGVKAMIHTLPKAIAQDYQSLVNEAGFRIKKVAVAPYCQALLYSLDPSLPENYLLVDMGAKTTSLSLIGGGQPYCSAPFHLGSDDLTDLLSTRLGIGKDKAEEIKKTFGYDKRPFAYSPSLAKGSDPQTGLVKDVDQKAVNAVIEEYFDAFFTQFQAAFLTLFPSDKETLAPFPLLLTGGGSQLAGLPSFFQRHFPNRPILFPLPRVIGCRDPRFSACLGLLIASSHYTGSLEDNYHGVAQVTRMSQKKEKKERRSDSPNEDAL